MKRIVISIFKTLAVNSNTKVLDLLEKYRANIMATGHFDDAKLSLSTKDDHYVSFALYPKSNKDWDEYVHVELPVMDKFLQDYLIKPEFVQMVHGWATEVPNQGLAIYKNELKAYTDWLSGVTSGFTEKQRKNLMGSLDTPDYDKARIWTGKLEGMAEILGLTKEEIEIIDAEFPVVKK